jgi:diaminopimelate epimerase
LIPFVKAHACGNDFLIVDQAHVPEPEQAELARLLSARTTGVGADGVEFFSWLGELEGRISLRNADGSVAEISGNGTRCVAAWMAHEKQVKAGAVLRIATDAGWRECRVITANGNEYQITSGMGVPVVEAASVTLADGSMVRGARVNTGNPHFVIFADDAGFTVNGRAWQSIGEEICTHVDFPNQTNVEFVRIARPAEIEIRIFERGVGPTTSSGTGTCASAAASIQLSDGAPALSVIAPGGTQRVEWVGKHAEMFLTGPAVLVSSGSAFLSIKGEGQS